MREVIALWADEFGLDADKMPGYAKRDDVGGEGTGWPGGSVPDADGRLLYALARAAKAKTALEFGTGHGCATSHIARALKDNGGDVVITLDRPDSIDIASYRMAEDLEPHVFRVLEDGLAWARRNDSLYFDLVFEDGPHTYEFTKTAVELSLPHLNPGGFILVHDVYGPHEGQVWPGLRAALPDARRILADGSICGLGYWRKPVD
jgi:predicted O-methyltransferase YrrM